MNYGMQRTNYHCVQDYNNLSSNIRELSNIDTFKQALRSIVSRR